MSTAFEARARGGLARALRIRFRVVWRWFRTSLTARVIGYIVAGSLLLVGAVGAVVLNRIEASVLERAVSVNVDQFEAARSRAQAQIEAANAPAASELQQLANELIANQTISTDEVVGATLLRSDNQPTATSFEIAEPSTQSTIRIRSLVTDDMRREVSNNRLLHWQSVALTTASGKTSAGLLVGGQLNFPGAGLHEFYVAYSLENEDYTLAVTANILAVGAGALILFITLIVSLVLHMVVRPVREASRTATILSEGGFDARMEVHGDDELARLGRSFNQMAASLSDQFTQLERMSKVQQEFVSAVSHELRSPVTTIRMAGQLIYDKRDELPPVIKRSAELQHDQLINLDVMLSDLLEISRFDAGAMTLASERADLALIVAECVKVQEPLAEANGVEVIVETDGDTSAWVESRRVQRIVRNLVVNALEHAEGLPVRIRTVGGDDAVAIEVSDRGVGLTPEQATHVFDRFWRADTSRVRKSGGTGLGLTIAREDALLHGGKLQCAGELGVGTTFLLVLPREVGEPCTFPIPLRVAAADETWGDVRAASASSDERETLDA